MAVALTAEPRVRRRARFGVCILLASLFCWGDFAAACTLFGAVGDGVAAGGGAVLFKNRDYTADHAQTVRVVLPEDGLAHVGLFAQGGAVPGLKAGVNEAGVAVVSAHASSASGGDWRLREIMPQVLGTARSAEAAARMVEGFAKDCAPSFYMTADSGAVFRVSIGPGHQAASVRTGAGTLVQTNHFADPPFLGDNVKPHAGSLMRFARMEMLLAAGPVDLRMAFVMGRDRALFHPATPGGRGTLSQIGFRLPVRGPFQAEFRLFEAGNERTIRYTGLSPES